MRATDLGGVLVGLDLILVVLSLSSGELSLELSHLRVVLAAKRNRERYVQRKTKGTER